MTREDGSLILKIEQPELDASFRPTAGPLQGFFAEHPIEAVIRITGELYVGTHLVQAAAGGVQTDAIPRGITPLTTTGGLRLTPFGFSA